MLSCGAAGRAPRSGRAARRCADCQRWDCGVRCELNGGVWPRKKSSACVGAQGSLLSFSRGKHAPEGSELQTANAYDGGLTSHAVVR